MRDLLAHLRHAGPAWRLSAGAERVRAACGVGRLAAQHFFCDADQFGELGGFMHHVETAVAPPAELARRALLPSCTMAQMLLGNSRCTSRLRTRVDDRGSPPSQCGSGSARRGAQGAHRVSAGERRRAKRQQGNRKGRAAGLNTKKPRGIAPAGLFALSGRKVRDRAACPTSPDR